MKDIQNLTYDDVVEIERLIELRKKADVLYKKFQINVKPLLTAEILTSNDEFKLENITNKDTPWVGSSIVPSTIFEYFKYKNGVLYYMGDKFNHVTMIEISPASIFESLKDEDESIRHFEIMLNRYHESLFDLS